MSNPDRIRPLGDAEWSAQTRALLGATAGPVGQMEGQAGRGASGTLNILRTIAHHPSLLGPPGLRVWPGWSYEDRLLLRAADELHRDQHVSDRTWADLRRRLNDAQLVELPFIVGNYTMLSMPANATGVPAEAGLQPLPDAPHGA